MHHTRGLSFSPIVTDSFAYESLRCLDNIKTSDFRAENDNDNNTDIDKPITRLAQLHNAACALVSQARPS